MGPLRHTGPYFDRQRPSDFKASWLKPAAAAEVTTALRNVLPTIALAPHATASILKL
jgi:hypothetical protein